MLLIEHKVRLTRALLVSALGVCIAVYLWFPIHAAWWYVTDDYRWPTILGPDKKITFTEFLNYCNPPDMRLGGKVNRPTYYLSTSLMMYLFGERIELWNATRILMVAVSLASIGYVLARLYGVVWAVVAVIVIAFHGCWSDILPRLQSELFSFFGFGLLILFLHFLFSPQFEKYSGFRRSINLLGLTLASIYLTGSKENITVLMTGVSGSVILLTFFTENPRLSRLLVPASITFIWGSVIAWFVSRGVLASGKDLYGNPVAYKIGFKFFFDAVCYNLWGIAAIFCTLLVGLASRFKYSCQDREGQSSLCFALVAQAFVAAYGGFLLYFYHGSIPPNSRYEYPFVFIPLAGLLIFSSWLLKLKSDLLPRFQLAVLINSLAIIYGVTFLCSNNLMTNRIMAEKYKTGTISFKLSLETLFEKARENPRRSILFRSHGLNDAEPLASVDLFLRANGISNPVYLEIIGYSEETASDPSEKQKYNITMDFLASGKFKSKTDLPITEKPIIANFSNPNLSNGAVGNFWPLW